MGVPNPQARAPTLAKRPPSQRACGHLQLLSMHCPAPGGSLPRTTSQIATPPWDPGTQATLATRTARSSSGPPAPPPPAAVDWAPDAHKSSNPGIPAPGSGEGRAMMAAPSLARRVPAGPQMPVRSDAYPRQHSKQPNGPPPHQVRHPGLALRLGPWGW